MGRYVQKSFGNNIFIHDTELNSIQCSWKYVTEKMNAYDSMLKRQAECGKTGHIEFDTAWNPCRHCSYCGADLTKGANHG